MENDIEKIVYDKGIIEFLTVATDFCNFMDDVQEYEQKDFIDRSLKVLPLIYLKATLLPEIESTDLLEIEKIVTQEEWQFVLKKVSFIMDDSNVYKELIDPMNNEITEPAIATISENFADIYQDIKDFVGLYQMGTPEIMRDAIAECKNNFKNYWGQSLVNALRALHIVKYMDKPFSYIENN